MTFHIGQQSGGVVNNVTGNQRVEGGQHGVSVSRGDAMSAAVTLREIVAATDLTALTGPDRATVNEDAAAIEHELATREPLPQEVVARLERLTGVLSSAGAFAGAGAALVGALTTIAQWLGPHGASVLRILPVG